MRPCAMPGGPAPAAVSCARHTRAVGALQSAKPLLRVRCCPCARNPRSRKEVVMFTSNPFAALSVSMPPAVMQAYVVVMVVLVAAGTLFDIVHKGSARYFFDNWRKSKREGTRQLGGGQWVPLAIQTGLVDVL